MRAPNSELIKVDFQREQVRSERWESLVDVRGGFEFVQSRRQSLGQLGRRLMLKVLVKYLLDASEAFEKTT